MYNLFPERLRASLNRNDMTPTELSRKTDIPISAISQYLSGAFRPRQARTLIIAQALNVDAAWLMGYDSAADTPDEQLPRFDNIFPIETKPFPLLGSIACGEPIWANEDKESYVEAGTHIRADFCLKAQGDSMINARIMDGDIVFIRKTSMVDNGEIAAVIIEDEATLKRVYYDRELQQLTLVAENPKYPPLVYRGEQLDHIHILGKAVAFQSGVV